jgi:hypothetical protein
MVRNGDARKPIWISEMNSNAVPVGPAAAGIIGWGAFGQVSLETQAAWAPLAYQRAQEEWPYVGVINFWFFKPASGADANQSYYYFRMLEPDFTPLPVYETLKAYANQVPRMYPGTHQEDHWAVNWEGEWFERADDTAVLGGYRLAGRGASARVCVKGEQFEIVHAPMSDHQAQLEVKQDKDGCWTLSAARGIAIDGFVVQRESGRLFKWIVGALASAAILSGLLLFWQKRRR